MAIDTLTPWISIDVDVVSYAYAWIFHRQQDMVRRVSDLCGKGIWSVVCRRQRKNGRRCHQSVWDSQEEPVYYNQIGVSRVWIIIQLSWRTLNRNPDHHRVREAFEDSLRDLDCEYIDLYLLHWPQAEASSSEWWRMTHSMALEINVHSCSGKRPCFRTWRTPYFHWDMEGDGKAARNRYYSILEIIIKLSDLTVVLKGKWRRWGCPTFLVKPSRHFSRTVELCQLWIKSRCTLISLKTTSRRCVRKRGSSWRRIHLWVWILDAPAQGELKVLSRSIDHFVRGCYHTKNCRKRQGYTSPSSSCLGCPTGNSGHPKERGWQENDSEFKCEVISIALVKVANTFH